MRDAALADGMVAATAWGGGDEVSANVQRLRGG